MRGVRKIQGLTRITGRRAMLWSEAPDAEDTRNNLELSGEVGKLLWDTLAPLGLSRNSFDVQNVLRCRPFGADGLGHAPTKRELQCCSPYNDEAIRLNRGTADVHLIFGDTAGEQLLGNAFKKDSPVMWHAPWDAYVVLAPEPGYIHRKGAAAMERTIMLPEGHKSWATKLRTVRAVLDNPGRFGHLKAQDNRTVRTPAEFDEMERDIRSEVKLNRRVSLDIEDDKHSGKCTTLLVGFGTGHYKNPKDFRSWSGRNWSVVLDHPESGHTARSLRYMQDRVKVLIEDVSIKKVLQNGAYDTDACREGLDARLRGYDYDTQYGTYLRYSFLRSCTLEDLTYLFFPEFCDYKDIVTPWLKAGFSKAPLDKLLLRNQGDVAVTKRLEARFSPEVRQPLVKVYIYTGITLHKMEKRGPILDWENWKKAEQVVPKMVAKLDRQLQHISGNPEFNCNAADQVAELIYDTLGVKPIEEGSRATGKTTLQHLEAETGHQVFSLITVRRMLSKIGSKDDQTGELQGTYLANYAKSARMFDDELRTRWALTGAVTGRLRSSGVNDGGVNLQNLHNNPLLMNMLVSDRSWRKAKTLTLDEIFDLDVYLTADGSQIEIRALAELSNDPVMIKLLQEAAKDRKNKQKDFHCLNGHMLTGRPIEQIANDKGVRRSVKNLIFGIIFGKARKGMFDYVVQKIRAFEGKNADLTGITRKSIDALYGKFFAVYKGVAQFIIKMRHAAETRHQVETLFGFVRHIMAGDEERTTYWGNQAINSPVQGTAHQFVLIAMALLELKPKTYSHLQRSIMEVHDALYFKVKLRHLIEAHKQLMHLFEVGAFEYAQHEFNLKLRVPLLAEAQAGFCMSSLIDYEGEPLDTFLAAWREKQAIIDKKSWEDLMPLTVN